MGAVCCCLREDFHDYVYWNCSTYRNCTCLGCFTQQLLSIQTLFFRRDGMHEVPSSIQEATPLSSAGLAAPSIDNSFYDTYRSPPRPLPYNVEPRYPSLQHEGWLSKNEKISSHFSDESEPFRSSNTCALDPLGVADKWYGSLGKHSSMKATSGEACMLSSEDEDVCPTCLEEYTPEDPKIITQCSHHFHLGCIYEWMERSETCPVCGKIMAFEESS